MSTTERIQAFLVSAERCEELAHRAHDEKMRELYRDLALQWRKTAHQVQVSLIEEAVRDLRTLYARANEPHPGEVAGLREVREELRGIRHRDQEITALPGREMAAPRRKNGAEADVRNKANLRLVISRP
jgi:hypothetical protein